VPGHVGTSVYPLNGPTSADLGRANTLVDQAGIRGQTAVLYTNLQPPQIALASLIRDELAQIGLGVDIHSFPGDELIARAGTLGEPFDMVLTAWIDDYPDPADTLNTLLDGTTIGPFNNSDVSYFNDPATNTALHADEQLTGAARYAAYSSLGLSLLQNQAPLAVIGDFNLRDFFSARIGCQTFIPAFGMDLAQLCVKR
jgi:ABC-type transport system substrate-binding protein